MRGMTSIQRGFVELQLRLLNVTGIRYMMRQLSVSRSLDHLSWSHVLRPEMTPFCFLRRSTVRGGTNFGLFAGTAPAGCCSSFVCPIVYDFLSPHKPPVRTGNSFVLAFKLGLLEHLQLCRITVKKGKTVKKVEKNHLQFKRGGPIADCSAQ